MKKDIIIISDQPGCRVTILHYPDDPCAWIVRKWVRTGLLRRRVDSRWFNHRDAAERYAKSIARDCGTRGIAAAS
jgi:hypothetical protein